jgi:predicted ATPase
MAIQRLEISGFRSLADVVWEPGSLNVLIGLNGSGKSNLLRALQLLKAAAEGRLSKTILSWGGMAPLVWDGYVESVKFNMRLELFKDSFTIYEMVLERLGRSGAFRIGREFVQIENGESLFERTSTRATIVTPSGREEIRSESIREDETLLANFPIPGSVNTLFIAPLREAVTSYGIYHDVRVDQDAETRRASVSRRDTRVEPDGSNLVSVLHTLYTEDRAFKSELNTAMKAAFGDEFEELIFPPAEDGRIQLRIRWRSLKREQSASDLSDGILRFLFLLAVLGGSEPPPLIAIDEPETGLHPSMLPLVAEFAAEAARRTQVILTTHSPQFLNAFQNRADIVTVVESREGKTQLRRLPEADLARWLEHYQLGELWLSGELEGVA